MDVKVERPTRTRTQALSPGDFADIAPCEWVGWDGAALVVRFAAALTSAQVQAVRLRCITADAGEEATLTAAATALARDEAWLARTAAPTSAQTLAHVDDLTRQMRALIRYVTRSGG